MAGNSNYPGQLDTDTELYRVDAATNLVPDIHNNHTDALQSIEATLGVVDDGSGSGITPGFAGGLAQFAGFPSTMYPNLKYPWYPIDNRSIYGDDSSSLSQWTLGAGVTADWDVCPGLCRLDYPNTQNFLIASVSLPAEAEMWCLIGFYGLGVGDMGLNFGFSILGDGTDIDGFGCHSSSYGTINTRKVENGVRSGSGGGTTCQAFRTYGVIRWNGSTVDCAYLLSPTPFSVWHTTVASRGTPTKFCFYTSGITPPYPTMFIDRIAFGWSPHPLLVS